MPESLLEALVREWLADVDEALDDDPGMSDRTTPLGELSELALEVNAYLSSKRKRLTPASERGYRSTLDLFVGQFAQRALADFQPPGGTTLIETWLDATWGDKAPRTYNKNFSILSDFFKWQARRGRIVGDPTLTIERARPRAIHRITFTAEQRARILAANPDLRDQIALRLLLDYGIRKGALQRVQFEHFDHARRRLVVFTKGGKIHHIPVPDETVWDALDAISEPAHHYLLPRQITRRRTPPYRRELRTAAELLANLEAELAKIHDDPCERERVRTLEAVRDAAAALEATTAAASTQTRRFPADPLGEHGTHDWWYRCLAKAGVVDKGVTRGMRMHSARHSAAQRVLEATGNLRAAQKLLGHASIQTTGDVYTDWDDVALAETMRGVIGDGQLDADLLRRTTPTRGGVA